MISRYREPSRSAKRSTYDAAWRAAEAQGAFDTLFFNERDELTEGGRSNVFVPVDGRWITPALSCGVLPGVMRAALLADPVWDANEASSRAPWSRAPPPSWPAMPCAVR